MRNDDVLPDDYWTDARLAQAEHRIHRGAADDSVVVTRILPDAVYSGLVKRAFAPGPIAREFDQIVEDEIQEAERAVKRFSETFPALADHHALSPDRHQRYLAAFPGRRDRKNRAFGYLYGTGALPEGVTMQALSLWINTGGIVPQHEPIEGEIGAPVDRWGNRSITAELEGMADEDSSWLGALAISDEVPPNVVIHQPERTPASPGKRQVRYSFHDYEGSGSDRIIVERTINGGETWEWVEQIDVLTNLDAPADVILDRILEA